MNVTDGKRDGRKRFLKVSTAKLSRIFDQISGKQSPDFDFLGIPNTEYLISCL